MNEEIKTYSPVVFEEVVNTIYCLENKQQSSKENIVSGLKQMIKFNLIETDNLSDLFIPTVNFSILVNKVKIFIKENNKNRSWPSYLNDIRTAVIQLGTIDISAMSFADSLFVLGQKKYGRITKTECARLLSLENTGISITTLNSWIFGRSKPTMTSTIKKIKEILDPLLSANGALGDMFYYPLQKNSPINTNKEAFITESPSFLKETEEYSSFKIDGEIPNRQKPFLSELTDHREIRAHFSVPKNYNTWSRSGDGEFKSEQQKKELFKFFSNSLKDFHDNGIKQISLGDLLNVNALTEMTRLAISGKFSMNTAREVIYLAKSEAYTNSYISQYFAFKSEAIKNFSDWKVHIELLMPEILELNRRLDTAIPAKDGAKNIAFILNNPINIQKAIHADIIEEMKKCASSYPLGSRPSFNSHASTSYYHISIYGCPLRRGNFCSLKWIGEVNLGTEHLITQKTNQASIYKYDDKYKIFVPRKMLKNRKSKSISDIHRDINYAATSIDSYLSARSEYLRKNNKHSDHFYFGSNSFTSSKPRQLGNIIRTHTLKAIQHLYPNLNLKKGINPHSLRHACATLFLADHHHNYKALATLLMDSLETVLSTYAKNNHIDNSNEITIWGNVLNNSTNKFNVKD